MAPRQISPHVTIYKFPGTAISSITNRITGSILSGLYVSSGISCLLGTNQLILDKYEKLNSIVKQSIHYSVILPTVYHSFSSIRHFIWDKYPNLLTNAKVSKSSLILPVISLGTTYILEKSLKKIYNN